jgi:hypothetical protein
VEREDYLKVKEGMKHIVICSDGKMTIKCTRCGRNYPLEDMMKTDEDGFKIGLPIWAFQGLGWGFAAEHSDCEPRRYRYKTLEEMAATPGFRNMIDVHIDGKHLGMSAKDFGKELECDGDGIYEHAFDSPFVVEVED